MMDIDRLMKRAAALRVTLPREAAERIDRFCGMVLETNRAFNLTAITDPDEMEEKSALDCLTLLPYIPQGAVLADVGCGAGFPGVVLALARPDIRVTLIEATEKKLRFAESAARTLGAEVQALHLRGEEAARGPLREQFSVVTARAVAALPALLEYTLPLVAPGGVLLAMKGASACEELAASANALKLLCGEVLDVVELTLPTAGSRAIVRVKKISQCSAKYPRPSKNIRKNPL